MSGDVVERLTDETQGVKREPVGISGMIGISADIESKRVLKLHFNHEVTDQDRANIVAAHNAAIACETAERELAKMKDTFRNADASDWDHLFVMLHNTGRGRLWKSVMTSFRTTLTSGGENGR